MNPMPAPFASARNTLAVTLPLAAVAGAWYAGFENIPRAVAVPLLAAVLIEIAFYVTAGLEEARRALEVRLSPRRLALAMTASAVIPYLVYAVPTGQFRLEALLRLAILAAVAAFWYACLPKRLAVDLVFVAVMAAAVLAGVFSRIYLSPAPQLRLEFLGHLMWIRTGVLSVLAIRHSDGIGFGFWPTRREWRIGFSCFLLFVPVGVPLALALGFASFHPFEAPWWQVTIVGLATFAGMLWVVALSEEFFFRGLLQRWLGEWLESRWAGLLIASLIFGLVHLPFRSFPNWRFATLAAVAGAFYGAAYLKAGGIRAAMVAHALVNTTWRLLFQ